METIITIACLVLVLNREDNIYPIVTRYHRLLKIQSYHFIKIQFFLLGFFPFTCNLFDSILLKYLIIILKKELYESIYEQIQFIYHFILIRIKDTYT